MEHDEIVERVRELLPLVEEHKRAAELDARMAREVFEAAGNAGLFRLSAPKELGGLEASLRTIVTVYEMVSRVDPTLAWYMGNSTGVCFLINRVPVEHHAEVFDDPCRNFAFSAAIGGTAEETEDGWVLNGQWPVVTGVLDAKWAMLQARVTRNGRPVERKGHPDLRGFLVPTSVMDVERIWDEAVAMRATGSHRVSIRDADLPSWAGPVPVGPLAYDRQLYQLGANMTGILLNASVSVGILGGAVTAITDVLADKVSTITLQNAADSTALLEMVAEADTAYRFLRAGLLDAADQLWDHTTEHGGQGDRQLRANVHGTVHFCGKIARETVSQLYSRSASAAFFRGHPLERALRDVHAVSYGFEPIRPFQHSVALVRMGKKPLAPGF